MDMPNTAYIRSAYKAQAHSLREKEGSIVLNAYVFSLMG